LQSLIKFVKKSIYNKDLAAQRRAVSFPPPTEKIVSESLRYGN
jgi:hypothetical protein